LMAGAAGCFFSLIMVGSMIAAYGDDFPSHPVAGRVAIGEYTLLPSIILADLLTWGSLRVHLRRQLLLFMGPHRMGTPK
jgi:hypothetical protein